MTPQEITQSLQTFFATGVQFKEPDSWQVESDGIRLLVLLSEDQSWLRSLVSIAPAADAEPYLMELLEANFDQTLETRYGVYQGVLWGIFQHNLATLTVADFESAIARLVALQQRGLQDSFSRVAERQIRQIIKMAKAQGQSLESTLQNLNRFYQEGVMGDIDQSGDSLDAVLGAWRYQLERLWNEEP